MQPYKLHDNGVTLTIRLTPNARNNSFNGLMDIGDGKTALKVSINAVPEDGKANAALIDFLAKSWKMPKSAFSILSGHTNRVKVVSITGTEKDILNQLLILI